MLLAVSRVLLCENGLRTGPGLFGIYPLPRINLDFPVLISFSSLQENYLSEGSHAHPLQTWRDALDETQL